jgi:hypothetical protein
MHIHTRQYARPFSGLSLHGCCLHLVASDDLAERFPDALGVPLPDGRCLAALRSACARPAIASCAAWMPSASSSDALSASSAAEQQQSS